MIVLIAETDTPAGVGISKDGELLYAMKLGSIKNHLDMRYSPPAHVYEFVKRWTGLKPHDFRLEIEYPPFHPFHPKGGLPEVLGEKRKPYRNVWE